MKFLLTSAGITNESIKNGFFEMVGKPAKKINVAFIPTAANIEPGDKWWLIDDYADLKKIGFAQADIVDISAVPKSVWQPRLEEADVLWFGGGNTFHLMHWIRKSGLEELLPDLLKTRVWVGTSAGSMVPGMGIINDADRIMAEEIDGKIGLKGLGFVDFSLKPHYLSPLFEKRDKESVAKEAGQFEEPMFAIDDNSAIAVDNNYIKVISEGSWEKFE